MTPEERKLEKVLKLLEVADTDYVSTEEIAVIVGELVSTIRSNKENAEQTVSQLATEIANRLEEITLDIKESKLKSEQLANESKQTTLSEIKSLTKQLNDEIGRVTRLIPQKANLAPLERRINEVERKIPTIPEIPEPDTPEEIREKLETLEGDERLSWKAVKGLEELIKSVTGGINQRFVAAGVRLFTLLNDTPNSYTGQAGKVVAVNSAENGVEFVDAEFGNAVQSVTGLNTDNTDPQNPVIAISVDGSTITGTGTPGDPLVSTGGSGITVEIPGGDVNSSNTSYTVTAQPKWVVADGVTYFDGAGYSYSSLTVEMDLAPNFSIRAII